MTKKKYKRWLLIECNINSNKEKIINSFKTMDKAIEFLNDLFIDDNILESDFIVTHKRDWFSAK